MPNKQQWAEVFSDIVDERRSIRAFKPEPVAQELMEKIFTVAQQAPSNCNTQPWLVHVASGKSCEQLRQALPEKMLNGSFTLDFPFEGVYHGVYKERQYDSAQQLYSALGIAREDKARRNEVFMQNFQFFGAPHVAFLFIPEQFGIREAADLGMYAQNLMLSLVAHGLACVPQTALSFHADKIREVLGIDSSQKLLFGISFGYADDAAPINRARTGRAALEETVVFHY